MVGVNKDGGWEDGGLGVSSVNPSTTAEPSCNIVDESIEKGKARMGLVRRINAGLFL